MAFGKHTPELLVDGKQRNLLVLSVLQTSFTRCMTMKLANLLVLCVVQTILYQVYDHEVSTVVVLDSPRLGTKYPDLWPPEMGRFSSSSEIKTHFFV